MKKLLRHMSMLIFLIVSQASYAVEITISCGSVGKELELCHTAVEAWSKLTGVQVRTVTAASNSSDRLGVYQLLLAAKSSDIDVFLIDTTWPGILGDLFVDFKSYMKPSEIAEFFPTFILNNTIENRLVAIPWFIDVGILFYRKDLLLKYSKEVPKTWEELTATSKYIQNAEHLAGNSSLWGLVFQGRAYEGLTCNILEWIENFGAGSFVDTSGKVTVNNSNFRNAIRLASSWIKTISPEGVLNYMEEDARGVFQSGNAVFMRNWPYAWTLANVSGSKVEGKVGITLLPSGGGSSNHSGTLGGWSLAVSKYSKHADLAVKLILYLTHAEIQKKRALIAGLSPTLPKLYQDPELLEKFPHYPLLFQAFVNAVMRPSRIMRTQYNHASSEIWDTIHQILASKQAIDEGVTQLERSLNRISKRGKW